MAPRADRLSLVLWLVLLLLLLLAACLLAGRAAPAGGLAGALGGAACAGLAAGGAPGPAPAGADPLGGAPGPAPAGAGPLGGAPGPAPAGADPLGAALAAHARALGPESLVLAHPLDRERFEPLAAPAASAPAGAAAPGAAGGAAAGAPAGGARARPGAKPWTAFATWDALQLDPVAFAAYSAQRAAVLNDPRLDWRPVLREVAPRLAENREYIGLANLGPDGALELALLEASPIRLGSMNSEVSAAGVPAALVERVARRPALVLFHTHPASARCSPLPSSHDLSSALFFAAAGRFAASGVISRYGVLLYGLDFSGYKAVHGAGDPELALLNLSHDCTCAHEAVRSWAPYSLADYTAFYARHRLLFLAYPSPEMVSDGLRLTWCWPLDAPIDHPHIEEHRKAIMRHRKRSKLAKAASALGADPPLRAQTDLGLDLGFD